MKVIQSIIEFHRLLSLPEPHHPGMSVIRMEDVTFVDSDIWQQFYSMFYCVSLKRDVTAKMKYGQQFYDYDKGVMGFTAPKQVQSLDLSTVESSKGYVLVVTADFLSRHPLNTKIREYGFFSYAVNEALHLSEREEATIVDLLEKIGEESRFIDKHTQEIILSQIDLLLSYANRFYERQFITRRNSSSDLLTRLNTILDVYFDQRAMHQGLPTVQYIAQEIGVSPDYLSDMLRMLTGQNTQQHIQDRMIEKAKEILSTTDLSVSEIAYRLGFEYPQSFSKVFKNKTHVTPLEFRTSFN